MLEEAIDILTRLKIEAHFNKEYDEAKALINNWDNPKDIVIPEDELPFY